MTRTQACNLARALLGPMVARQILAMAETRGTTDLRRAGIPHRMLRYRYTGEGPVAAEAAAELGVEPARLFKTLVVLAGDEPVFALVPADRELALKLLASAAGVKHAQLGGRRTAARAPRGHRGAAHAGRPALVVPAAGDLAQLLHAVRRLERAHRPGLRSHDQRVGARSAALVAHTSQQVAVRHT